MDRDLQQSAALLVRDFGLEPPSEGMALPLLLELLTARVAWLIDHDFNGLLNLLYRIDVDEQKARLTLAMAPPGRAPEMLAGLILERQLQKVRDRRKYTS